MEQVILCKMCCKAINLGYGRSPVPVRDDDDDDDYDDDDDDGGTFTFQVTAQ
jgi:hypothetical protein